MAEQSQRKVGGGGRAKKIVIGVLVVVVLAAAVVILAGPTIAGALAPGIIASAAKKQIRGDVSVDKVALSWTGKQRIERLRITDPDGGTDVVLVDGVLDRGLLGLITNPNDLGTLHLSGVVDVVELKSGGSNLSKSLEPAPGASTGTGAGVGTPRPTPSRPSEPLRLPKGFRVKVEGSNLELKYTTVDAAGATTRIGLKNVAIDGGVDGADAKLTVIGDSLEGRRALEIHAAALGLVAPDGTVDPSKAAITVKAIGEAPAGYIETLAGITAKAGDAAGARVDVELEGKNGRLSLVGGRPAVVEASIPAAMLSRSTPGTAENPGVSFGASGPLGVKLEIRRLDVPLPTSAGLAGVDWRGAAVEAVVSTGAVGGTLTQGPQVREVKLDPSAFTLYSAGNAFDLGLGGTLAMSLDGVSTGGVMVDVKAVGNLDPSDGTLRLPGAGKISGSDFVRAQIQAQSVPTALVQPFVKDLGINLTEVLGEAARIDIRAGQLGAQAASGAVELDKQLGQEGASKELAGLPYLSATLESPNSTAFVDVYLDTERLRTRNNGIKIETSRAGGLARRFVPADGGIALEGTGAAILEITNLELPLKGEGVDLRDARGTVRAIVGDMTALVGEQKTPIGIDSVDLQLDLAPGDVPKFALDARGLYEGRKFAALGSGTVPGVLAPASDKNAPLGLSAATARPQGEITLIDVPTGLAKLASTEAATMADAVFGETVRGVLSSTPGADDSIDVKVRLEGNAAIVDGAALVRKDSVSIGSPGITANFAQAGSVLNAMNAMTGNDRVSFSPGGKVTVAIHDVNAPLGGTMDVKTLSAGLDVTMAEITGSAKGVDGSSVPLSIVDGAINGALEKGGAYNATLAMNGTAAGKDMRATGSAKGKLPEGGDQLAAIRAIDEASLEAHGVPTSLIGLFDPKTAAIAMEAAGDTADIAIKPAGKSAWTAQITGPRNLKVDSGFKLDGANIVVGEMTGALVITPALVDAVVGETLDAMTPRPRLDRPVPATLEAKSFRLASTDKGWGLAPGESIVAKAVAGGDIVVRDAAQLGEGKPASVGVRGFTLDAMQDGAGIGNAKFGGLVFEPDANTAVATVAGDVRLPASPLVGNVHITDGNVPALDQMLAMDGLLVEALGASLGVNAQMEGAGGAVTADVKSPRLTASASLARGEGGSMTLRKPIEANWKASPAAIDRLLLGAKPGTEPGVRATNDVDIALTVDRLALGPSGTPLKPGVFDLSGTIKTGRLALKKATGEALDFPALAGAVKSEPQTRGVSLNLASAPGEASTVKVVGRVDRLSDEAGKVDADNATVTADIDGTLPVALVDGAASMDGLLAALLGGPTVKMVAHADNFGRQAVGGKLDARITAENASANLAGQVIAPSVMLVNNGSKVEVSKITKEASDRIFGVLIPFLTSFEKSSEDEPASVVLNKLEAPLDGDTRKLNGEIVMDLGTMRFETKSFLGDLLKIVKQKDAGQVGKRIEPVTFLVNKGVATYTKMIVPAGEFKMESYGTLDLNDKKMDVYVLVPAGALAEEFVSQIANIPGLSDLTAVPLSIRGPFNNPKTKLDLEEMIRRAPNAIGNNAEGLLGGVLGGVLGGDKDSDGDNNAEPKKELTPEEKAAKQQKKAEKEEAERAKKEAEKQKKKEKEGDGEGKKKKKDK